MGFGVFKTDENGEFEQVGFGQPKFTIGGFCEDSDSGFGSGDFSDKTLQESDGFHKSGFGSFRDNFGPSDELLSPGDYFGPAGPPFRFRPALHPFGRAARPFGRAVHPFSPREGPSGSFRGRGQFGPPIGPFRPRRFPFESPRPGNLGIPRRGAFGTPDFRPPMGHFEQPRCAMAPGWEMVLNKLEEFYFMQKLSREDLDQRAIEALKHIPVEGALVVLDKFVESNLDNINNKSAYLCSMLKNPINTSLGAGSDNQVYDKLEELYCLGKLSREDLDERAIEALYEFSVEGALAVLDKFVDSNLSKVVNKSAYLCSIMKNANCNEQFKHPTKILGRKPKNKNKGGGNGRGRTAVPPLGSNTGVILASNSSTISLKSEKYSLYNVFCCRLVCQMV